MTLAERCVLVAMLTIGLVLAAAVEIYDSKSVALRVGLALSSIAVSFAALRAILKLLGVREERVTPATLWGLLGWSVIPLSQISYVGHLLIPIEVLVAAILISFRGVTSMSRALLAASVARALALAATLALRTLL